MKFDKLYSFYYESSNSFKPENLYKMTFKEYEKLKDDKTKKLPHKVLYINKVEVIQNPTSSDYRQISKEVEKEYPRNKDAKVRFTEDAFGNRFIWAAHKAIHSQIEPSIKKLIGRNVSQNEDYVFSRSNHRKIVFNALKQGKNVPQKVLDEYPDLIDILKKDKEK